MMSHIQNLKYATNELNRKLRNILTDISNLQFSSKTKGLENKLEFELESR